MHSQRRRQFAAPIRVRMLSRIDARVPVLDNVFLNGNEVAATRNQDLQLFFTPPSLDLAGFLSRDRKTLQNRTHFRIDRVRQLRTPRRTFLCRVHAQMP